MRAIHQLVGIIMIMGGVIMTMDMVTWTKVMVGTMITGNGAMTIGVLKTGRRQSCSE